MATSATSCCFSVGELVAEEADRRDAGIAHVALGQARPLDGDLVDDQAEREGRHGEVVAAQLQRRIATTARATPPDRIMARTSAAIGLPAVGGGQDRGAVAAERREGVLAERRLARIAHEEVEAGDEDAVDGREADHGHEIAARPEARRRARRAPTEDRDRADAEAAAHAAAHALSGDSSGRGHGATGSRGRGARRRCSPSEMT